MTRVYAKTKTITQYLFAAVWLTALAGCSAGGMGLYAPWSVQSDVGIVTKNLDSIPDIAWQTQDQRETLSQQSEAFEDMPAAESQPQIQPDPVAFPAGRKLSVALLLPMSGKDAALGQSMLKAAQMALFDVGSANFELVPHDTRGTTEGAVAAATRAVGDHADLILGPVFADDVKAIKPVIAPSGIPVITFTTDWTVADDNVYVMGFLPFAQVARVAQYASAHGYKRFGVYAPKTDYGDVAVSTLGRTDVDIVKIGRYSPRQSDISLLVADFAETSRAGGTDEEPVFSFDALFLPLGGEGLRALVSFFDQSGVKAEKVKFIGTGLWDDTSLIGHAALFGGWFAAPNPILRRDFEARYQENYGSPPLRLASLAYDSTALAAVLARSGSKDGSPYTRARLTNPRGFAGIDGIFRFRPDGLAERGLAVLEIQSGGARVVDPGPTAFLRRGG